MSKQIIIGCLAGLITNFLGIVLYLTYLKFSHGYPFSYSLEISIQNNTMGNIVAIGALPCLGLFYLFLQKNKIYLARGVVISTMMAAAYVLISKF